jgi:DNA invertase Pin-like site-specific DNA recombinase
VNALFYCRQSVGRDQDGDESISVQAQIRHLTAFAERSGYTLVGTYQDVDISGARFDRPGLASLFDRVDRGGIDAVIVYDISRLSRDTEHFLRYLNRLKARGVRLVSTQEQTGERWLTVLYSALGERDREIVSIKTAAAVRERARAGQHIGMIPIGYDRIDHTDDAGRTIRRLVPNVHASLIRELFARYDAGMSLAALSRWLNEPGNPPPARAARWSHTTLGAILRNRAYVGDVTLIARPGAPAVLVPDAHPAIVDRAVWQRVQERIEAVGARQQPRHRRIDRHWLEGAVTCVCGAPMYLVYHRHTRPHGVVVAAIWRCRDFRTVCTQRRHELSQKWVAPVVVTHLEDQLRRIAALPPVALRQRIDRPDSDRQARERRLAEIATQRRKLAVAVTTAHDPSHLVALDNTLAGEETALRDALAAPVLVVTLDRLRATQAYAEDTVTLLRLLITANDHATLRRIAVEVGLRVIVASDTRSTTVCCTDPIIRRLSHTQSP